MLKETTVSGSRVVEGESQEHNFNGLSSTFSYLSSEATYQCVNINTRDFQAEYEKEKAQGNGGLLSYWWIGIYQ